MMRAALVVNGIVVNVILVDEIPDGYVVCPDHVGMDMAIDAPAPVPVVVVPDKVTMRQARLALLGAGLLANVNAAINAMTGQAGDAARIEWEYALSVDRNSTLVAGMAAALSLTTEQLDTLFTAAATL